jgi:hypothetical protein
VFVHMITDGQDTQKQAGRTPKNMSAGSSEW